jgi:hypothetical protein
MTTVLTVNLAAQEQAAMHRTQLLLARCRGCRPPCAPMVSEQASWHARQQSDFLAWLDAGGFAQAYPEHPERAEHAPRGDTPAAASCAPSATQAPRTIENSGMTPLFSVP